MNEQPGSVLRERQQAAFPKSGFGDVDYMDKPRDGTSDRLHMAFGTQKPRHVHFLRTAVFSSAYYTKATCWSYENERRMLVDRTEVREVGGMLLMAAPNSCLTSIIAGPRASAELQHNLRAKAAEVGCKFFQLKIGRSSATPYFIGEDGKSYVHKDGALRAAEHTCDKCKEPSAPNAEVCSWCQIDDSHRFNAARRNPYRMLDHYGLLDSYIEGVTKIDREAAQRRRGSK